MKSEQPNHGGQAGQSQIRHDLKYLHSLQDHVDEYFFATVSIEDWSFQRIQPEQVKCLDNIVQELVSKPFLDFIHPEDAVRVKDLLFRSIRDGYPQIATPLRFRSKDGSYVHLLWFMMHVPEQGLSYVRTLNITERFSALEQAKQAKRRYQTLFDEAADSMLLIDSHTSEILAFNPAAH